MVMLTIKNNEIIDDISELSEFKVFVEHKKNDITNVFMLEPMFLQEKLKEIRQKLIKESMKYIWQPSIKYTWPDAGMDEKWFDCSGFVTSLLKKFGLDLPDVRHSYEYFDTYGVNVHEETKQPWDLVFFSKKWIIPTHMWILISDNEYIHAPWKDDTFIKIDVLQKEIISHNYDNKIYGYNPIWFKRISLNVTEDQKKRWNLKRFNKLI